MRYCASQLPGGMLASFPGAWDYEHVALLIHTYLTTVASNVALPFPPPNTPLSPLTPQTLENLAPPIGGLPSDSSGTSFWLGYYYSSGYWSSSYYPFTYYPPTTYVGVSLSVYRFCGSWNTYICELECVNVPSHVIPAVLFHPRSQTLHGAA